MKGKKIIWLILSLVIVIICSLICGTNYKEKKLIEKLYKRIEPDYIMKVYQDYQTYIDSNFYNDKLVTYDTLNDESKLYYAYQIIENKERRWFNSCEDLKTYFFNENDMYGECISFNKEMITKDSGSYELFFDNINKEKLEKAYHILFGEDKILPLKQFTKHYVGACMYSREKDNFICFDSVGGNETSSHVETKFEKYNKQKDSIEIYDRYVWVNATMDYDSYDIKYYKNRSESELIKKEIKNDEPNSLSNEILKKGALYKHTFKKDNKGNYYWFSSERVG